MTMNERIARFYFTPGHQKRFEGEMRFLLWIITLLLCRWRRVVKRWFIFRCQQEESNRLHGDTNVPLLFRKIFPYNYPSETSFLRDFLRFDS